MEVRAVAKYVRVQPRKVRIIADKVRGKDAGYTAALLRYHPSKGAKALRKVLISAMANAQENHGLSPEALKIATIMVDEGPRLKRLQARAMGRGNRIVKKTSHITVVVEEAEPQARIKPHGTQAKPRPKLAEGKKTKKAAAKTAAPEAEEAPVEPTAVEETPVEAAAETPVVEEAPAETAAETVEEAPVETSEETVDETPVEAAEEAPEATDEDKKGAE